MSLPTACVYLTCPPKSSLYEDIVSVENLRLAWDSMCVSKKTGLTDRFSKNLQRNLYRISESLQRGTYLPAPAKLVDIPKKTGGVRQISILPFTDRLIQKAVLRKLEPVADEILLPISYGYRKGKSVKSALADVQAARDEGFGWVFEGDIIDFFGNIDHNILRVKLSAILTDVRLIKLIDTWLRNPVIYKGRLSTNTRGLLQGSVISPLLSNLYLADFDRSIYLSGFKLFRFADDFIVLCASADEACRVKGLVQYELEKVGLRLNEEKSSVSNFKDGFFFLGSKLSEKKIDFTVKRRRQMKAVVYIREQGSIIRKKSKRLIISKSKENILEIPFHRIKQLVLFGNVSITTPVISQLLSEDIDVVFLNAVGMFQGRLEGASFKLSELRLKQVNALLDKNFRLKISTAFVSAKIKNTRTLILRHLGDKALSKLVTVTDRMKTYVDSTRQAAMIDELRGLEGSAAREFFQGLALILKEPMGFCGRNYFPPKDPVNSMLSFGYTLLYNDVLNAVSIAGLDPGLGFLHEARNGRASLALDLIEEFRPVIVDSLVITLINKRIISPKDFSFREDGKVLLSDTAIRKYINQYEKRMLTMSKYHMTGDRLTYRQIIHLQARQLAKCIRSGRLYEPVISK